MALIDPSPFKTLNEFNLDQAVSVISLICSDHVHVLGNVNTRCLYEELSEMTLLSIKSGGWFIWANFLDTIIDTALD